MSDVGPAEDMGAYAVAQLNAAGAGATAALGTFDVGGVLLPLSLGDVGATRLISLSPADGSQLNVDPEIARFTPIAATVEVPSGFVPIVSVTVGTLAWLAFDGTNIPAGSSPVSSTGFAPWFREHSTIANLGDGQYALSIIPNGGWWRSSISIRYFAGNEALPAS